MNFINLAKTMVLGSSNQPNDTKNRNKMKNIQINK